MEVPTVRKLHPNFTRGKHGHMRLIGIHGKYMTGMMSVVALSFGGGGGGGKGYFSPGDVCVMNEGILRFE